MKRVSGCVLAVIGVLLILFGLLFLVGSGGKGRRLVIAAVSLGLGGVATGFGIRRYKLADKESPEQIRAEILELARRRNGEVAEDDLRAALGRRFALSGPVIDALAAEGSCQRRSAEGSAFFVFKDLQPRLMHLECEYCGAELPISEETDQCPSCGGTVKSRVARHAVSGDDYFFMDEPEE